ncbi:hypothetical protein V2J09_003749 [Rumex salicifolius]
MHPILSWLKRERGPSFEKDPSRYHFYASCGGNCIEKDVSSSLFIPTSSSLSSSLPFFFLLHHHHPLQREREKQKKKECEKKMGNCQAVDAAAMVIQHPNGKIERLYWAISASEVMANNPGHYVSLIIPLPDSSEQGVPPEKKSVRYTRVKLLRPTDNLVLGHAYRLLTSQEVMKVVKAKKYAKLKKSEQESTQRSHVDSQKRDSRARLEIGTGKSDTSNNKEMVRNDEGQRARTVPSNPTVIGRSKSWRPSLQSISEAGI